MSPKKLQKAETTNFMLWKKSLSFSCPWPLTKIFGFRFPNSGTLTKIFEFNFIVIRNLKQLAIIFLATKIPHALKNTYDGACEYFAFQWL